MVFSWLDMLQHTIIAHAIISCTADCMLSVINQSKPLQTYNMTMYSVFIFARQVNSIDMFAYFALMFTKSRTVVSNSMLSQLHLTKEAEKALRSGKFR